ncbi:uncharacterized protein LOC133176881 [Saccostrea echinata]|uniref:uncharacterized protein LOC133176881 n=1 Tax=Saccostrea echinata TaxID=191078 RepID=UPI002A814AEC|nr:uncharacterized protein LOC133176881 [Saccostrea echinata]
MDPRKSAQDIIRCDLCEDAIVQMYCDFCHANLCFSCIGKHISDDYDKHKVVPFQQRKSTLIYPKCTTHQTRGCEFHCKTCNTFVCSLCTISDTHKGHTVSILSEIFYAKKKVIGKDAEVLENTISPTYAEIATEIETQIANLDGEYGNLTTSLIKYGEEWHREIDSIVEKLKIKIEKIKTKHGIILKEHLEEIKQIQYLIKQSQLNLEKIEDSNEVSLTMEYISRTKEFSKLPPKVQVSLPMLSSKMIDTEQLYKLFGSLTLLSTTTEENGYKLKKPETSTRELLEEPELITTISTGYENLRSVICFSEKEIWTSAQVNEMKCFSIQGSQIKTIKSKTGEMPGDIAVTNDGDLVYSDWKYRTVNKVKEGQTEKMIILQGWTPLNLCITSSGDLLVTMFSDDKTQSKVVRYSGSKDKQTIQFDDEGKPLYSGNYNIKHITENRNFDVCVADWEGGSVVVVNQNGKLRFRYTGHPSSPKKNRFEPSGITTDSQNHILTTNYNHCIHILDENGQFLRCINNCDLKDLWGLSTDKNDNLFVAEYNSGKIKKIKYMK